MVVNELKSRTVYILGVISVAVVFLAYQVKTPLKIDWRERGDATHLGTFYDVEHADDWSYRWSSDSLRVYGGLLLYSILAALTRRLPVGRSSEASRRTGYELEELSL